MADMDPPVDDIFAGMKKKKKGAKKVVNIDEFDTDVPAPAAPSNDATSISGSGAAANPAAAATPADAGDASDGELDLSSIKKKKKKSVRIDSDPEDAADMEEANPKSRKVLDKLGNEVDDAPLDTQLSAEVTAVDASGMDEFADLKKKRKKASKKAFDLDAFEKELAEAEAAQDASGEPKGILKKPTPAGSDDEGEVDEDDEVPEGEDPFGGEGDHDDSRASKAEAAATAKAWLNEDRDYHYTELLGRFYSLLYQSHPALSGGSHKKKYTIPPPQLFREGSKRSVFANIADICKRMHRSPEHVIQFLFAELGTNGSVDGSAQLVIKGRFQQKQIENVLRRYIVEYVTCKTCKSPDTTLTKDNRLFFMTCSSCGSTRSVAGIKTGFQATTRAARRAARA
ncbi:hypothetical protein JCM8202_005221 [Rhodotorula sphaerocarpa]